MKTVKIFATVALVFACKYSAGQVRDAIVLAEYNNWLKDYPRKTYIFMDSMNRATYKERINLDSSYTFFAMIPIKDSLVGNDIQFVEVPGHPVPDTLKKRVKEMVQWTNGKWAGSSKKIILRFIYNRPDASLDEAIDNGYLTMKYWLTSPGKSQDREIHLMDTNYLCIVYIW